MVTYNEAKVKAENDRFDRILSSALSWFRRGYQPVPVEGKKSLLTGWTTIPHTFKSEEDLIDFFIKNKDRITGFAIRCGAESVNGYKIAVIDVDNEQALDWVIENIGIEPQDLCMSRTFRGYHIWLLIPDDILPFYGEYEIEEPHIEFRLCNRYCLAPPSEHPDGGEYRWINKPGEPTKIDEEQVYRLFEFFDRYGKGKGKTDRDDDIPEPIATPNAAGKPLSSAMTYTLRAIEQAKPGNRHNTGLWLACQLRDLGLDFETAKAFMLFYQQNVPPHYKKNKEDKYDEREALATLRSVYRDRRNRKPAPIPIDRRKKDENTQFVIDLVNQYIDSIKTYTPTMKVALSEIVSMCLSNKSMLSRWSETKDGYLIFEFHLSVRDLQSMIGVCIATACNVLSRIRERKLSCIRLDCIERSSGRSANVYRLIIDLKKMVNRILEHNRMGGIDANETAPTPQCGCVIISDLLPANHDAFRYRALGKSGYLILRLLMRNRRMKLSDIVKALKLSKVTVLKKLKTMIEFGLVRKVKRGVYEIAVDLNRDSVDEKLRTIAIAKGTAGSLITMTYKIMIQRMGYRKVLDEREGLAA